MSDISSFSITLGKLSTALQATGLPYSGFSPRPAKPGETAHFVEDGIGFFVELHFPPEAKPAERQQLKDLLAAFDFRERKSKSKAKQLADLNALSKAGLERLVNQLLVEKLMVDPGFARRAGVDLDGDETALSGKND